MLVQVTTLPFGPTSAVRLLGVFGQQAYQQQRQEVQARGDAEDQACGGEVGADGRVPGPGEEHRAEGGDADSPDPQIAAWAIDSLTLYVNAYSLEISLVNQQRGHGDGSWVVSRDELLRRFAALPGTFPQTKRYAAELTAGTGHDRFDFTMA